MQYRMVREHATPQGDAAGLIEPSVLRGGPGEGERRLLLAVLEDGIRTALKHAGATRGRPRMLLREALAWLASDARDDCFHFARICEALDIDAVRLRGRVLARVRASTQPGQLH
jgi:hypothetical protein